MQLIVFFNKKRIWLWSYCTCVMFFQDFALILYTYIKIELHSTPFHVKLELFSLCRESHWGLMFQKKKTKQGIYLTQKQNHRLKGHKMHSNKISVDFHNIYKHNNAKVTFAANMWVSSLAFAVSYTKLDFSTYTLPLIVPLLTKPFPQRNKSNPGGKAQQHFHS